MLKKLKSFIKTYKNKGFCSALSLIASKIFYIFNKKIEEVDISLLALKALNKTNPIAIDVGAHYGSSTISMIENGFFVYAFEPDPVNKIKFTDNLKGYESFFNLECEALSNKIGQRLDFYSSDVSSGISSLHPFHYSHKKVLSLETITLNYCLEKNEINYFDFLKIDVEGYDYFVLQGLNLEKYNPSIIVAEFENKKTESLGHSYHDISKYLFNNGYSIYLSEWYPIKKYGGHHSWKRIVSWPHDLDPNAWGNIIAVKNKAVEENLLSTFRDL